MSIIFNSFFYSSKHLSIFEIYPQSEIPQLTQIANFSWSPDEEPLQLLSETLICLHFQEDRMFFRIVD